MRIALSLVALLLTAAGVWQVFSSDDPVEREPAPAFSQLERGDPAPAPEATRPVRVTRFSGIQTTVPDTLGYDERTAIFTLEEGGFRVRVLNRHVSSSGDDGIVVQQRPPGGATRRVGWIVTIFVGGEP